MGVCPENDPDLVNRDPNALNSHIKVCMSETLMLKLLKNRDKIIEPHPVLD